MAIAVAATLALAGCGGGGSGGGGAGTSTTATLSGVTLGGRFVSGSVCAYRLAAGVKGTQLACSTIDPVTSAYSITVNNYTGDVLLEIGGGAAYDDEANPADNLLGTSVPNGSLRSLVHISGSGTITSAITPFTEAALRASPGLTLAGVTAAAQQLRSDLGIDSTIDFFATQPSLTPTTGAQLGYVEALRALSQLQFANASYANNLTGYLDHLVSNQGALQTSFQAQVAAGLSDDCSVVGNTLTCGIPGSGGGGGGGGGGGTQVCGDVTCGAGTSPGGITPAAPAVLPTISRLSGSNTSGANAAAWAAAKLDMKSHVFNGFSTALATISVTYGATVPDFVPYYNTLEMTADKVFNGRNGTFAFGPDGLPLTADDVMTKYSLYFPGNTFVASGSATFVGAGADGIWRNGDDVTQSSTDVLLGLLGADGSGHHIVVPMLVAGADKVFFTADDNVSNLGWDMISLDANGHGVQDVHYQSAGVDGTLFTADDVVASYTVFDVDVHGNALKTVIYSGKGTDNTWFTADDVVLSATAGVISGGKLTHVANFGKGPDTVWFNADDVISNWIYYTYDANDRVRLVANHNNKGADDEWFTGDDLGNAATTLYDAAGHATQVASHSAIGADGQWFTGDDTVSSYTKKAWSANSTLLTLSATFNARGTDGLWFTADDVPNGQYYVRGFNADGLATFQTNFAGVGVDGVPFTADDVRDYTITRYQDGVRTRTLSSSQMGADGLGFTADDVISPYAVNTMNAANLLTKRVYHSGTGPDNTWFTADDPVSSYSVNTYDAQDRPTTAVYYTGAGADGIWETADDVVNLRSLYNYDAAGNQTYIYRDGADAISSWAYGDVTQGNGIIDWIGYSGAGEDAVWLNGDDVISYVQHSITDASGRATESAYGTAGEDGIWHTTDDYTSATRYAYDAQGAYSFTATYVAPGSDGLWFTADDVANIASYFNYPWN